MATANIASDLLQEWISAMESNDVDQITNLYRADAVAIGFAGAPSFHTGLLIHDLYSRIVDGGKTKKITLLSQNPHVFGTVAVNSGHYIEQIDQAEDVTSYFSFVYLEDDDGMWKIFSHHFSLVNFILNEFSVKELRQMLKEKEKENYSQDMR